MPLWQAGAAHYILNAESAGLNLLTYCTGEPLHLDTLRHM